LILAIRETITRERTIGGQGSSAISGVQIVSSMKLTMARNHTSTGSIVTIGTRTQLAAF
jgi:hypothetical protein